MVVAFPSGTTLYVHVEFRYRPSCVTFTGEIMLLVEGQVPHRIEGPATYCPSSGDVEFYLRGKHMPEKEYKKTLLMESV